MSVTSILAVNALVLVVTFLIAWLIALRLRDVTFIDSLWAIGMVVMAAATLVQTQGDPLRKGLLTGLCAVWGVRLGGYLLARWRKHGADRRYERIFAHAQEQRGWGFAKASLLLVFATQAPLLFIVCLPVQLGQVDAGPPVGIIGFLGVAVAVIGIAFETIGDAQLTRFKSDPANDGRVMDRGLWRYTRHPNYFGDACTWWGLYLIAAETPTGLWALPGPVLLTWLLLKWSGVPTTEGRMKRKKPGYEDYVRRTSGFVPWWPKA
jgi:steroid 5-alpha reductase family enzyme